MSTFFMPILTGVAWMGLTADLAWGTFVVGALLGLGIWRLERASAHRPFGVLRAARLVGMGSRLLVVFLWEMVVTNYEQLLLVLAPRIDVRPGWIQFRSELETPAMRALLGMLITLTPGSMTYEASTGEDGVCYFGIHVLDLRDEARVVEHIRSRFEEPLLAMESL